MPQQHVLETLSLPSRYEPLVERIGPEVLRLLVPPGRSTMETLEEAAAAVRSLGEGLFLPIHAPSGTGKTTLAENLTLFQGSKFTTTVSFSGEVSSAALTTAMAPLTSDLAANDTRVIPINIDHRESRPPTAEEISEIKRFLRQGVGRRALAIWPETDPGLAASMSASYRGVSGVVPLDLPVAVQGPPSDTWPALAEQTLQLANQIDSLDRLLDLTEYEPSAFRSIGDYLRQISTDFNKRRLELERATSRPVRLTILWVTETSGHGILASLTSSARFGMLDPSALLQACADSVIGQWWSGHRGLLVQTIVSLDAHVFAVSPPLSLAVIRRYGPEESQKALTDLGFNNRTPAEVSTYLRRSDLGRYVAGEQRSVAETRGNPAEDARVVFDAYAAYHGFHAGKDKKLNRAFATALQATLEADSGHPVETGCESALPFLPSLVPDVWVDSTDLAHCFELTYRKGEYLVSKNRSAIAQYCLTKLKNYARSLGWVGGDE